MVPFRYVFLLLVTLALLALHAPSLVNAAPASVGGCLPLQSMTKYSRTPPKMLEDYGTAYAPVHFVTDSDNDVTIEGVRTVITDLKRRPVLGKFAALRAFCRLHSPFSAKVSLDVLQPVYIIFRKYLPNSDGLVLQDEDVLKKLHKHLQCKYEDGSFSIRFPVGRSNKVLLKTRIKSPETLGAMLEALKAVLGNLFVPQRNGEWTNTQQVNSAHVEKFLIGIVKIISQSGSAFNPLHVRWDKLFKLHLDAGTMMNAKDARTVRKGDNLELAIKNVVSWIESEDQSHYVPGKLETFEGISVSPYHALSHQNFFEKDFYVPL